MAPAVTAPSPFERLLGAEFARLPAPVRRIHSLSRALTVAGQAEVSAAPGLWPWLIAAVAGLPKPGSEVPVEVVFAPDGRGGERWRRRFAGRRYASTLGLGAEGTIVERMGPFSLAFHLRPRSDGLEWSLVAWRFAGLPLPRATLPAISCRESGEGGRFRFAIRVAFPLVGPVVSYRGWLAPS